MSTQFYAIIPLDDNRATDGKQLREQFTGSSRAIYGVLNGPCSVLEMLVALAKRADGLVVDSGDNHRIHEYFGSFLDNLGLTVFTDYVLHDNFDAQNQVRFIIERWLSRDYLPSGEGGLFPLIYPDSDQRYVEIWHQMNAWLAEKPGLYGGF